MKKGFTLVEILAVLAIVSVVLVITIPNITENSKRTKEKMYETKKESILKAYDMCTSDGETNCKYISTLLSKNYIVPDDVNSNSTCSGNCIKNPVDGTYLDSCQIVSGNISCS